MAFGAHLPNPNRAAATVAHEAELETSTDHPGRCFLLAMLLGVWIGWGGGASLYGVAVKVGENGWEASAFAVALGYVISHSILLVSISLHVLSFPFFPSLPSSWSTLS